MHPLSLSMSPKAQAWRCTRARISLSTNPAAGRSLSPSSRTSAARPANGPPRHGGIFSHSADSATSCGRPYRTKNAATIGIGSIGRGSALLSRAAASSTTRRRERLRGVELRFRACLAPGANWHRSTLLTFVSRETSEAPDRREYRPRNPAPAVPHPPRYSVANASPLIHKVCGIVPRPVVQACAFPAAVPSSPAVDRRTRRRS